MDKESIWKSNFLAFRTKIEDVLSIKRDGCMSPKVIRPELEVTGKGQLRGSRHQMRSLPKKLSWQRTKPHSHAMALIGLQSGRVLLQ